MVDAFPQRVLIAALLFMAAGPLHAQPLFPHTRSIESIVANADMVFVAKIKTFEPAKQPPNKLGNELTIEIEDTLKIYYLQEKPYRALSIRLPQSEKVLKEWQKRAQRLLVAYDAFDHRQTQVISLDADSLQVMTADFRLLRQPDAVIDAAREAIARIPKAVRRINTVDLAVPRKLVRETTWEKFYRTGGHLMLSVPVDSRLEKRAREYLQSTDYMKRMEGLKALWYFQSDDNIQRLKSLLNDSGATRTYSPGIGEKRGLETTIYAVRGKAYYILKSWGVKVKKPVIRVDIRK